MVTVWGINNHLLPLASGCIAKEVTPVQVKLWINEFNKLNRVSARRCVRALRCAFEIAEENGLVYKSPVLARYKAHGRDYNKREALTPEQGKGSCFTSFYFIYSTFLLKILLDYMYFVSMNKIFSKNP